MLALVCMCLQQELDCSNYLIYQLPFVSSHMAPGCFGSDSGGLLQFSFLLTKPLHLAFTT